MDRQQVEVADLRRELIKLNSTAERLRGLLWEWKIAWDEWAEPTPECLDATAKAIGGGAKMIRDHYKRSDQTLKYREKWLDLTEQLQQERAEWGSERDRLMRGVELLQEASTGCKPLWLKRVECFLSTMVSHD